MKSSGRRERCTRTPAADIAAVSDRLPAIWHRGCGTGTRLTRATRCAGLEPAIGRHRQSQRGCPSQSSGRRHAATLVFLLHRAATCAENHLRSKRIGALAALVIQAVVVGAQECPDDRGSSAGGGHSAIPRKGSNELLKARRRASSKLHHARANMRNRRRRALRRTVWWLPQHDPSFSTELVVLLVWVPQCGEENCLRADRGEAADRLTVAHPVANLDAGTRAAEGGCAVSTESHGQPVAYEATLFGGAAAILVRRATNSVKVPDGVVWARASAGRRRPNGPTPRRQCCYGKRATRLPGATDDDSMSWVKTVCKADRASGRRDMRVAWSQHLALLDGIEHIPIAASEASRLLPEERAVVMARILKLVCDRAVSHFANGRVESRLAGCGASTRYERERAPPEALPVRRPSKARYASGRGEQ